MKKLLIIFTLSLFIFSCRKKEVIAYESTEQKVSKALRLDAGDFKSKDSGIWSDTSVWQQFNGTNWVDAHDAPDQYDNVFLDSLYTVELSSNASCKDLNLNGHQDVVRIKTNSDSLFIWGKIRTYRGAVPGYSSIGQDGAGVSGWISGNLCFKGSSDRVIVEEFEVSANSRSAGWNMIVAFDSGYVAKVRHTVRCGHLIGVSGILDIQGKSDGLANDYEIRTAGSDYAEQPGNGVSGGTVLVKSGATIIGSRFRKNSPTSIGNSLASFTLEPGSTFISKISTPGIAAVNYNLAGDVVFNRNSNQWFVSNMGNVDADTIKNYSRVILGGSGAKRLINNITVSDTIVDPANLFNTNGFTVTY